jgi:crotonobetainyl-CoA:carnitine CoA-transferase CaiB-like acyl-CoA transferase
MHEYTEKANPGESNPAQGERALEGVRVLDFGQYVAGPLLALMLADQGAEVIRIDPPGGPVWNDDANAVLQRGKKSLCLDLKSADDVRIVQDLVATADILVENFRPGVMKRLGIDYENCRRSNPRLIYASLPGFAHDDPRAAMPGWEGIVSAASGLYTPYPAQRKDIPGAGADPAVSAVPIASNFSAFMGANAVIAALIARERDGVGQWLEIPLFNAAFEAMIVEAQQGPPPTQNSFHIAADHRFPCADGRWGQLLLIAPRHLQWFVRAFLPHLAAEGLDEIDAVRRDAAAGARLVEALRALFATRPAAEWETLINAAGVPFAVCQTTDHFLLRDPQARAAGAVIDLEDPELSATAQLGYPVGLSLTPPRAWGPRRALDADRAEILADLSARAKPAPGAAAPLTPRPAPLAGVRVVDMSQVFAAPGGARILAQFGAEIIKINPPDSWLIGHLHFNSGKRTVLLDVGAPEGREVLVRLIRDADVFVQNLRSDTALRLGVDEASVRAVAPEIVFGAVTPYGQVGEKAEWRGWEPVGQAVTGLHLRTGEAGRPQPARFPLCDFGTSHLFAFALLLGLWVRRRTGRGQRVDSSLMQAGAYQQAVAMIAHAGQAAHRPARARLKGHGPLDRLYRVEDGWIYIRARELDALQDIEPLRDAARTSDAEAALESVFASRSAAVWIAVFAGSDVAAHRLLTTDEAMESDYAKTRKLSLRRSHRGVGPVRSVGVVVHCSDTPLEALRPAPAPGGDTLSVLSEIYGPEQATALIRSGVAAERLPDGEMLVW